MVKKYLCTFTIKLSKKLLNSDQNKTLILTLYKLYLKRLKKVKWTLNTATNQTIGNMCLQMSENTISKELLKSRVNRFKRKKKDWNQLKQKQNRSKNLRLMRLLKKSISIMKEKALIIWSKGMRINIMIKLACFLWKYSL